MQLQGKLNLGRAQGAGCVRGNTRAVAPTAVRAVPSNSVHTPVEPRSAPHSPGGLGGMERWPGKLAAAMVALAVTASPGLALAEAPEPVYFGNGCFWGRQYDFVNTEMSMGRGMGEASAVVGYAGGKYTSPDGHVCYYLSDPKTVYEKLGHAEVVQVSVDGNPASNPKAAEEFRTFADTYFKQFKKTPVGMMRSDPQDKGPGYRNVVGIPGGVSSPFFPILKEANQPYGMELREGSGNEYKGNKPTEDDLLNVVWVVDSNKLPFYRAEKYHQYHTGLGKMFPWEYLVDMKNAAAKSGKIGPTGCPELPF